VGKDVVVWVGGVSVAGGVGSGGVAWGCGGEGGSRCDVGVEVRVGRPWGGEHGGGESAVGRLGAVGRGRRGSCGVRQEPGPGRAACSGQ
jgi:hypothetical protein